MFPEGSFSLDAMKPLSYKIFINEVLVREAAVLLIQQDLCFDWAAAIKTLQRSGNFGTMLHPGEDSPHLQAVIDKTIQAVRQQENLFQLWKASDSTLSFNDWAREQKADNKLLAAIKHEGDIDVIPMEFAADQSVGDTGLGDRAMEELGFKVVRHGDNIIYELDD